MKLHQKQCSLTAWRQFCMFETKKQCPIISTIHLKMSKTRIHFPLTGAASNTPFPVTVCKLLAGLMAAICLCLISGCASSQPDRLLSTARVNGSPVKGTLLVNSTSITPQIIKNDIGRVAFEPPSSYLQGDTLSEALQKSIIQSGLFAGTSAPQASTTSDNFNLHVTFTRVFVDLNRHGYCVDLTATLRLSSGNPTKVDLEETVGGYGAIHWPPMNAGHQRAFEVAFRDLTANAILELAARLQPQTGSSGARTSANVPPQQLLSWQFYRNWPKVQIGMTRDQVFALIQQGGVMDWVATFGKGKVASDVFYTGRCYLLHFNKDNILVEKRDDHR